ncbi:hypothetical protein K491DRAFT_614308, partial [Lophiostoma macrostomum CBS 122681]
DCLMEQYLETEWHFQREAVFRDNLKTIWSTVDSYLTALCEAPPFEGSRSRSQAFNKPTACYFEQSAQYGRYDDVHGYPCIQRIFIGAIYAAWRARYQRGDDLDIEFGHFLATPVRITKQGPQSLGEIATAHQAICDAARKSGQEDETYKMMVSYPQVVLVFDRPAQFEGSAQDDDGILNLRKVAEQLTVLVMRTGAPGQVTLDDLDSHAVPLERSDAHGVDVRRVPLGVAVYFIVDLEDLTKQRTTPKHDNDISPHEVPRGFDRIVKNDPRTWVVAMMECSASARHDSPRAVEEAIERSETYGSGASAHFDFEHEEWSHHWRSGYGAGS